MDALKKVIVSCMLIVSSGASIAEQGWVPLAHDQKKPHMKWEFYAPSMESNSERTIIRALTRTTGSSEKAVFDTVWSCAEKKMYIIGAIEEVNGTRKYLKPAAPEVVDWGKAPGSILQIGSDVVCEAAKDTGTKPKLTI